MRNKAEIYSVYTDLLISSKEEKISGWKPGILHSQCLITWNRKALSWRKSIITSVLEALQYLWLTDGVPYGVTQGGSLV